MNDNDIVNTLECLCGIETPCKGCVGHRFPYPVCKQQVAKDARDLINRQKAEIEQLKEAYSVYEETTGLKKVRAEAIKEFAEKIDQLLNRYSNLHKYADKVRHSMEDYPDGTPVKMVSVWEVLSLKKWEMVEYETMSELQGNIETIAKEFLLSELEKDFHLLIKEMTEDAV